MSQSPLLEATDVSRAFGAVKALDGASLTVQAGEVHGLVGANGAGKSTLIKIAAGLLRPSAGEIKVDGNVVEQPDPVGASALGMNFIHQELNLIPQFTILQNLVLGTGLGRSGPISRPKLAREKALSVLNELGLDRPLSMQAKELSVPEQWLVTIGRALMQDARLIVMDEPTASLSSEETSRLFDVIERLRARGVAILYVSHRLNEIVQLCDSVTVFRNGSDVAHLKGGEITKGNLVTAIVGSHVKELSAGELQEVGEPILEVRNLRSGDRVNGATFTLNRGEVLGIAGLVGAGRTELLETLFGVRRITGGEVALRGENYSPKDSWSAIKRGVALVPEERKSEGLVIGQSISFNLNLPRLRDLRNPLKLNTISIAAGRKRSKEAVSTFGIKVGSILDKMSSLSGGNQQKVVLAKWMVSESPDVLLLDEPTRGVDVGSRSEIYTQIRELTEEGLSCIVVSSEFDELAVCDRVLIMVEGQLFGEVRGTEINEENLVHLCYAYQEELHNV